MEDRVSEQPKRSSIPLPQPMSTYSCYRDVLAAFFAHKKATRVGFSHRRFAKAAGVKSPNYLQLVMQGKRNLSGERARDVATALGLTGAEFDYFIGLVDRDNAEGPDALRRAEQELEAATRKLLTRTLTNAHLELIANWFYLPVRELVFLPDFQPTGAYISAKLAGLITEEQAIAALRFLMQWNFIAMGEDGRFVANDIVLDTGDHVLRRAAMDAHHRETLRVWSSHLPELCASEQERGLLNIPLSTDKLPELRERLRRFQDELIGWVQAEQRPDRLVQVGIYCVPFPSSL